MKVENGATSAVEGSAPAGTGVRNELSAVALAVEIATAYA